MMPLLVTAIRASGLRCLDVGERRVRSRYYTGELAPARGEPPGKWGVMVVSQTLYNTPTGGDAVAATSPAVHSQSH